MDRRQVETEVLVVGAGPTGLMLANWLAKLGIAMVLADGKSGPTRESRALGLQSRSLEIYDQLGLAEAVVADSTRARRLYLGYEAKMFGMLPIGRFARGLTPFEGITFYEQSKNEQLLADSLSVLGTGILWNHRLSALDTAPDGQGVSALLTGPDGEVEVRARYCVGTDGGSSTVRGLRGIPFEGVTNPATFYVADATKVRGLAPDGINVRPGTEDFLLGFPMGGDAHVRLIGTVRDTSGQTLLTSEPNPLTEAEVRERLARVYGVAYGPSAWFATYRVHHRIAARFRDGAVFLAGDAAHVHSPVGAQGMNTGLQDAHNLAFKLADVLRGRASESYLDRYEAERRPVARRLVATTDRLFGFVTSVNPLARAVRRGLMPVLAPVAAFLAPRTRRASRLFEYVSQIRVHYWMSEGAKEAARGRRGTVVGRRLQYTGDNFAPLRSLQWQVHAYGNMPAVAVHHVRSALELQVHVLPLHGNRRLQEGMFYLVRPDGFVAAESRPATAVSTFAAALRR
jgi:2-polyprenyl-6-methoxyphenol hydroxylase-like FAD-dependent oxidoreductase